MNPDDLSVDEPQGAIPASATPASARPYTAKPSLEMVLAQRANEAIQQGADPKAASDILTAHIRYARANPVVRDQAENALRQGADPKAVLGTYFQVVASDPLAATHIAAQSGKLGRVVAAENSADVGAAKDAADADTYGSRLGKLLERKVGIVAGNTPATLLTMAGSRAAGAPLSRAEAAKQVASDVAEAGQNEPGIDIPYAGRVTLTDLLTGGVGYSAAARALGTKSIPAVGAVMEGGKRLLAPEEEGVGSRLGGTALSAAMGAAVPAAFEGAGSVVQNIGQRTGATDMLGKLANAVGASKLAQNIGTSGAVNDLLRTRQALMEKLGISAATADQYLDQLTKQGQRKTTPAYDAAAARAAEVEAAPSKAAQQASELMQRAEQKALPAPGQSAVARQAMDDVVEGRAPYRVGGKFAAKPVSDEAPRMTLEQAAQHNYTWPVGEAPGAPSIQSSEPGAPNYREPDYTKVRPVELRAANDVNVRRPEGADIVPPVQGPDVANIPAEVKRTTQAALAHPRVQEYLKDIQRPGSPFAGKDAASYEVLDQVKRDLNSDWGKMRTENQFDAYGRSLRNAKNIVQDALDALSQGKAGEANAVYRQNVAIPREGFEQGFGMATSPTARQLEAGTLTPEGIKNWIARLPENLQGLAADAVRAGRGAEVGQSVRQVPLPETAADLLKNPALDVERIRPAFKTEAQFQQFVRELAAMRQVAAQQAQGYGPLKAGWRSFASAQNPLATPRGIAARTVADAQPFANIPGKLPLLSSLWQGAVGGVGAATNSGRNP